MQNVEIEHYFNAGQEYRIGPYRVDGFDKTNIKKCTSLTDVIFTTMSVFSPRILRILHVNG